jgi:hypothetical protein
MVVGIQNSQTSSCISVYFGFLGLILAVHTVNIGQVDVALQEFWLTLFKNTLSQPENVTTQPSLRGTK